MYSFIRGLESQLSEINRKTLFYAMRFFAKKIQRILMHTEYFLDKGEKLKRCSLTHFYPGKPTDSNVIVGALERKTLREYVEEIHVDLQSMQREMQNGNRGKNSVDPQIPSLQSDLPELRQKCDVEKIENIPWEFLEEFSVPEIKQKTCGEERAWMKLKFDEERAKLPDPADGASLVGKTVESISASLPGPMRKPSCVLKLSNHLNSDLLDLQETTWWGSKNSGPTSIIEEHSTEAFSYQGYEYAIEFLLSFRLAQDLRLAVAFSTYRDGSGTTVHLGFVPDSIPMNLVLISDMKRLALMPDFCKGGVEGSTVEFFIDHGDYLVRAKVSPGPRSVVHLDILEAVATSLSISPCVPIPYATNDLGGLVEIRNALNVSLKNPSRFTCKHGLHEALPAEVLPFTREAFFSSDNTDLEGMFSYEIASTDLGLAVAFQVQENSNAFYAAFVPLPAKTDERAFNLAMDEEQWKSHLYRKYAQAKDGEQEIRIRNIRARVSMTDEEKPQLKIQIFTV